MSRLQELGITPAVIQRYDQRIPRYTSYPTAPFWKPEFDAAAWQAHLEEHSTGNRDLSLYVHIPFCGKRCLFCGCNVIITRKEGVASEYLDVLQQEVRLLRRHYRGEGRVIQLHLGGGTPNFLDADEMLRLQQILSESFDFSADAERSIEVDPRVATPQQIESLARDHGFRRISFGVQDFHEETQLAIGREQTLECTLANAQAARDAGFHSINIDLIYGLPEQTIESWRNTIDAVLQLQPERIALYNFAFLPSRLPHQRSLDEASLPSLEAKLQMFMETHDRLTAAGWDFIGMDHYARRDDSLAVAQRHGSLRRNFMGYSTLRGTDLLAFGTSAISDFAGAFAQNVKKLSQYDAMVAEGLLPVERGLRLSPDDLLRQHVIEELMCNNALHYTGAYGNASRQLVHEQAERLAPLAEDGLVETTENALLVTPKGRLFLRNIAVVFDAYMQPNAGGIPLFSRSL